MSNDAGPGVPEALPRTVAMAPVFGGKSKVSMFEMTKLVSGHVK